MPPHLQILNLDGSDADAITVSLSGGESSAVFSREIWNDKLDAEEDTTTAVGQRVKLLASTSGGPYRDTGVPILDERWGRFRVTHYLDGDNETTVGATGTLPIGTNAEIPIDDLAPQQGIRVEFQIITPGGQTVDATKIKLRAVGNLASSPLAQFVALGTGSGIVPADRANVRTLLRGSIVTADDSDTVTVSGGQQAYDGRTVTALDEDVTFTLADSLAVNLGAGEHYNVTLSRADDGALTTTKGPEGAVVYPDLPADEILVGYLIVRSADGIAVTVAPADVDQDAVSYAQGYVRAGSGLTALVSRLDAISSVDLRQYVSHEIPVSLSASETNRLWLLPDGGLLKTLTDADPEIGAQLIAIATTDGSTVTEIVDARRFVHRSLTEWSVELRWRGVLSTAGTVDLAAWMVLQHDAEAEEVGSDLSDVDVSWTGGAVKIDVMTLPPGEPLGDGTGATSIFTNSGTDDRRPTIAYDATVLRSVTQDHEVRRLVKGTRIILKLISTIAAPGPEAEQDVIATLILRRYR